MTRNAPAVPHRDRALSIAFVRSRRHAQAGIAMQGISAAEHLPGLEAENPMPLVPPGTGARLWIGN